MDMGSYLTLDCITANKTVMRLLPPEIAYRYHALPVSTDGNQITVAMAFPGNSTALKALKSVIDAPICIIQADQREIDHRLNELWPETSDKMIFLLWSSSTDSESLLPYSQSFANSFGAKLDQVDTPCQGKKAITELGIAIQNTNPDLLIFQASHPSRLSKAFQGQALQRHLDRLPALLVVPPNPDLPLEKVLLVLPDSGSGSESAINWTVKLAQTNRIEVTVLPIMPPVPVCYGEFIQHNLDTLCRGNDPFGKKMRLISARFSDEQIHGIYKLREGDPFGQIRDEIFSSHPDLIIMPPSSKPGLERLMSTDLISQLFKCISIPVLIAE